MVNVCAYLGSCTIEPRIACSEMIKFNPDKLYVQNRFLLPCVFNLPYSADAFNYRPIVHITAKSNFTSLPRCTNDKLRSRARGPGYTVSNETLLSYSLWCP